ncbi:MAG: aminotransferase class V-fold PLP-dependent enzyme, partial [Flavobacteriaceae bacterium]
MKAVYFDNAATTPVRTEVIKSIQTALENCFGNPSSTHSFGRTAKTAVEQARKTIAATLGAHPSEIIFTSGGTEADNMVLKCAVRDLGVKHIVTTTMEHHAVLHTVDELVAFNGVTPHYVAVDANGNPDLLDLEKILSGLNEKVLVSLMHINNEIGNILDLPTVAALCESYGAYFHSDTVQSIGHFPWDLQKIKIHFLAAAAHKFHGPKGIGFAYIRKDTPLKSFI